jgi:hypothetical protein
MTKTAGLMSMSASMSCEAQLRSCLYVIGLCLAVFQSDLQSQIIAKTASSATKGAAWNEDAISGLQARIGSYLSMQRGIQEMLDRRAF